MLNPFIELISSILGFFSFILLVYIVLGLLFQFNVLSKTNQLVNRIYQILSQIVEPVLEPIRRQMRRFFPRMTMVDLSPIIAILLINFISSALYHWFYSVPAVAVVSQ